MTGSNKPAEPLDLPEVVRAWARGRCDRVLRARADGSVTLTMLLPGETVEAGFASGAEAAQAVEAGTVAWITVSRVTHGAAWGTRSQGT